MSQSNERPLVSPQTDPVETQTLEEQEPVLHTGEGPLGFRSNLGIPAEQSKALISELL